MIAALLTLLCGAILLGGGSNLAQEGVGVVERLAGVAMMGGGLLAVAGAFLLVLA